MSKETNKTHELLADKMFKEISQLRDDSKFLRDKYWELIEFFDGKEDYLINTESFNGSNYAYVGLFKRLVDDIIKGNIKLPKTPNESK